MEERDVQELKTLFDELGFLAHMSLERFEKLALLFDRKSYKKGEMIIRKDDIDTTFYLISKGSAQAFVEEENDEVKLVRTMWRKDFFGEISMITGGMRTAWVVATIDVEAFTLSQQNLGTYMMTIPEIADKILYTAKSRLIAPEE
jgi:CRP-like cAMP-binding protein